MSRRYFGTDGVRGCVGKAPITPDFCMRLGYAAGKTLVARENLRPGEHPAVIIGKDTRISGYMLESALEAGFSAAGVDVYLAGPLPTPAIAYMTRALRLQVGVVISASHNPFEDNGIKFFSAAGTKLPDAVELEIEARLDEPMGCEASASLGKAKRIDDARGRYVEFCKSTFPNEFDLRSMKIALDCAHGAAYMVAPKVFHELGADLVVVGAEPNGMNINDKVGATAPSSIRDAVLASGADLGISLDGDGDRIVMVDAEGAIYDGDKLLYVIAKASCLSGQPVSGVVGTLMSNLGFEHALARLGIPFARAKVGDRYVLEMLHERGWKLGGENSGHIICLDWHTTGDGIIAGLQVLAALGRQGVSLKEMCEDLVFYPQKLINVRVQPGFNWTGSPVIEAAVRAAEADLGDTGRVLLRPSGTEPLLRVMVEGRHEEQVLRLAQSLAEVVKAAAA
ncbi:phosphoglucosamine mutase [Zoogloea sp.]|uniref:phosphoglucosamine mutase n=1 Tax=Zoogloea sp. TaxID=49181 RepID=UPI00263693EF|nr:phosphoglucosamine mutase [Zoogloea sp.]MDD3354566.1 phosphoglucosamine mutase [Zoogloea sp.]